MIDKLKQQLLSQGLKLLSNPKVAQVMADPRLMNALTKGMEIKGTVQKSLDGTVHAVASALQIATRADLADVAERVKQDVRRDLRDVEDRCGELERRVGDK